MTAVRFIPLTRQFAAMVDEVMYESLAAHKWHLHNSRGKLYARRAVVVSGKQTIIHMHHVVWGSRVRLDHKNGSGLDNRIANLREATVSQNGANSIIKPGVSGLRGVTPHRGSNKFKAQISFCGKRKHLGLFNTKEEAAEVYNYHARLLFGEFAVLNEVERC